jgi:hypothetical protein
MRSVCLFNRPQNQAPHLPRMSQLKAQIIQPSKLPAMHQRPIHPSRTHSDTFGSGTCQYNKSPSISTPDSGESRLDSFPNELVRLIKPYTDGSYFYAYAGPHIVWLRNSGMTIQTVGPFVDSHQCGYNPKMVTNDGSDCRVLTRCRFYYAGGVRLRLFYNWGPRDVGNTSTPSINRVPYSDLRAQKIRTIQ